jgi:predicted secreted hydrolase
VKTCRALLAALALLTAAVPAAPASAPAAAPAASPAAAGSGAPAAAYAPVTPGRALVFPRDYGSHPDFRTEWWYVTGWLTTVRGETLGFQVTFFRTKPAIDEANPSAFAARQLLIAHCAISDPKRGRLWQDQRIRRAGLGLAEASPDDTQVWIDDWSLKHDGDHYTATLAAEDFALNLVLHDTQRPLLNGIQGVSRKGPAPAAASYYYSLPHMQVSGSIARNGDAERVTGEAWFDHEWSSQYLDDRASGWDWIGINLNDGAALMAFRIRGLDGSARWAGGSLRAGDGSLQVLGLADVHFVAEREWTSPRTGIRYPVQWRVSAGPRVFEIRPLLDDQENDTRLSTGAIYWEGAVRAYEGDRLSGRGYLELTGYGERLKLR